VKDTFNMLHDFIQKGGLANLSGVIKLGDYIDLEGGLNVANYPASGGTGGFNKKVTVMSSNGTPLLRIIVVGINSFNKVNSNNTPHVVFQFLNVPVSRRLNVENDNTTGYLNSEIRKYLIPTGSTDSGVFLAGLITAGVPENILWAPSRRVSKKGYGTTGADVIEDKLWLPTEREIFNATTHSSPEYESASNQTWLEYYTDTSRRHKYQEDRNREYWLASPRVTTSIQDLHFVCVREGLTYDQVQTGSSLGISPAFCIR
jgi:hypothetical protein